MKNYKLSKDANHPKSCAITIQPEIMVSMIKSYNEV